MKGLIPTQQKERDGFKQSATLDEALDAKLNPVIDAINSHVEKIYKDFNTALLKQIQETERVERDVSHMVKVLWGIVNKANARSAALESVLLKNGMNLEELKEEIIKVEKMVKESGQMDEFSLQKVAEASGLVTS